jgi:hypothetical protein
MQLELTGCRVWQEEKFLRLGNDKAFVPNCLPGSDGSFLRLSELSLTWRQFRMMRLPALSLSNPIFCVGRRAD